MQTGGPAVVLDDPTSPDPTFDAPEGLSNSDITFELRVTDGDTVLTDTVTITVNADDDAPLAQAGFDQAATEGGVVQLGGSGAGPEEQALTYEWVQTGGPPVELSDPNDPNATFEVPEGISNYDLTFELHVSDGTNTACDTLNVAVDADNDAPSANAGAPQMASEGELITLSGTGYDPEGQGLQMEWIQVGGPLVELDDPNAANPTFVMPSEGTGDVRFMLVVSDGVTTSADTVSVFASSTTETGSLPENPLVGPAPIEEPVDEATEEAQAVGELAPTAEFEDAPSLVEDAPRQEGPNLAPLFRDVVELGGDTDVAVQPLELPAVSPSTDFSDVFVEADVVVTAAATESAGLAIGEVRAGSVGEELDHSDSETGQGEEQRGGFLAGLIGLFRGIAGTRNEPTLKVDPNERKSER